MKSPVKDLISQVITLLDSNVTVTHDKRGSETLNAYTSVPNGKQSFMPIGLKQVKKERELKERVISFIDTILLKETSNG